MTKATIQLLINLDSLKWIEKLTWDVNILICSDWGFTSNKEEKEDGEKRVEEGGMIILFNLVFVIKS